MSVQDIIKHTKCPFAKSAKFSMIIIESLNLSDEIYFSKDIIFKFFRFDAKIDHD